MYSGRSRLQDIEGEVLHTDWASPQGWPRRFTPQNWSDLPTEILKETSEVAQDRRPLPETLVTLQRDQVLVVYEVAGRIRLGRSSARHQRRMLYRLLDQYDLGTNESTPGRDPVISGS